MNFAYQSKHPPAQPVAMAATENSTIEQAQAIVCLIAVQRVM